MITLDLDKARDIVYQVGHCHAGFGSNNIHTMQHKTAHRTLDETKHLLKQQPTFDFCKLTK